MSVVLVTGATGFVGRELVARLDAGGVKIRCAVRDEAAARPQLPPNVELVAIPRVDGSTQWSEALRDVSLVYHLAARAHILEEKAADPLAAFLRVNTDGTRRLAESASESGVRRMVFVSTIKVNGERTFDRAFRADDVPAPVDPYGVSKQRAEEALRETARVRCLEAVIVRPPLVYGPGVRANFLKLMQMVDRGIPLPLGALDNRRSLVSIWNLCDLLVACGSEPAAANRTFMVCDGHDLSTPALVRALAHALGKPARLPKLPLWCLRFAAKATGQMAQYARLCFSLTVDMNDTLGTLRWRPPLDVAESLARTVAWYRSSQP